MLTILVGLLIKPTTRPVRQQRLLGFLEDASAWFDVVWQAIEKLYACVGWLLRAFAKIYGGEMTRECCSCFFVHPQQFYYTECYHSSDLQVYHSLDLYRLLCVLSSCRVL